jgi:hypothetical protein
MLTTTQMYWFTRLDQFSLFAQTLIVAGGICLFGFVILSIVFFMHRTTGCEDLVNIKGIPEVLLRTRRTVGTAAVIILFFGVSARMFTPTTKEMAAIYVIPKVVNNEKLHDAGDKLYNLAVEWMETLRPSGEQNDNN